MLNEHLITPVKSAPTENGGKRIVSADITTRSRGLESKPAADGDVDWIAKEGVALLGAAARHSRPSNRIERRKIKAKHVARSHADKLGRLKNDLVEPQLGRFDVRLSDQRVDGLDTVEERVRRGGGRRSPDLQEDAVLDGHDLGVDLPA